MRTLLSLLIGFILLTTSCADTKPKGLLREDDMRALLKEVHLLDGYLQTLPIDSSQKVIDTLYRQLLSRYDLDSVAFERNVDYYYADPVRTEQLYTQMQEEFSEADRAINRSDSIRYALQRDSLERINRYQRLLDMQMNLRNVQLDTAYQFNMDAYKEAIYRASGLQFLWQRSNLQQYPARPGRRMSPSTSGSTRSPQLELESEPEPLQESVPVPETEIQEL